MKILFYINAIHHGGAERVMANLAKRFAGSCNKVILVTSFRDEWEYPLDSAIDRINLIDEIPVGFLKRNILIAKKLRSCIKNEKPDVIVSFMAEPNFRMLLATIGIKCRKIISVRNDPNKEYPNFLFKSLAKTLYNLADGVVFQTEDAMKWFPKSIQKKSRIIMNQVDEVFFNTPLAEERHDIVTTGRLTAQKNHKMLIRAFSQIAGEIDDNLIIYGEGELRDELESLVKDLGLEERVFLPGATKNVPEALSKAKLFVLSSDYEGMPNALLEAMAMGLPCISTDCPCGGPRMVIRNGENGFLFPVGNEEKLCEILSLVFALSTKKLTNISKLAKKEMLICNPEIVIDFWRKFIFI